MYFFLSNQINFNLEIPNNICSRLFLITTLMQTLYMLLNVDWFRLMLIS